MNRPLAEKKQQKYRGIDLPRYFCFVGDDLPGVPINSAQTGRRGRRPLQLNGVVTLVAVTFSLSFVNINPPTNQNLNISPLLHNILSKGKK